MIERVKEMKNEIQLTSEVGTMLKVIEIDYVRTINHRTMIDEQIRLQRHGGVGVIEKI